jgi:hypothetical protein
MPPVLYVPFHELPRRSPQYLRPGDLALRHRERHHVLELIAKAIRATRLIKHPARPTLAQCSALFKTNEVRVARQGLPPLSGFIHSCRCVTPSASTAQSSRSKVVPGGLKLYS